jgi:hypothetical protein
VVVLYFSDMDIESTADSKVQATRGADALISTLRSLIAQRRKKSA